MGRYIVACVFKLSTLTKGEIMKQLNKDEGFTLVESILVLGLVGVLLVLLSRDYVSVYNNYIKMSQKANNLEEARLLINHITDNFRKYEGGVCKVWVGEPETELLDGGEGTVQKIVFKEAIKSVKSDTISYDKEKNTVIFERNEISSNIRSFKVKRTGPLFHFVIEVGQNSNAVIPEQKIEVKTTVILQYMNTLSN